VFTSLRGGPMTIRSIHFICSGGRWYPVHPHILRHAAGFYLANAGEDTRAIELYRGHKNIQHTVRYTELTPQKLQGFLECLNMSSVSHLIRIGHSNSQYEFRLKTGFYNAGGSFFHAPGSTQ
jgi:hypothetical protein